MKDQYVHMSNLIYKKVRSCCFFADGTKILSSSQDKTVKIWTVADGSCVHSFTEHSKPVTLSQNPSVELI